jgi:hypothetical protein
MFGDLLATEVPGPLTATINGQTTVLQPGTRLTTPGQPTGTVLRGTVFNFDTFINTGPMAGTRIPAGTPYPITTTSAPSDIIPARRTNVAGTLAVVSRGAFKITENESPRPQDRAFATYNYFNNVSPVPGLRQTDVHREVIGFERTFLEGDASFGMRLPILQVYGDQNIMHQDIGDLTVVMKFAFLNDHETGNVASAGVVLTFPTGGSFLPRGTPDIHDTLIQPWVGGIANFGDFFLMGFSSFVIPTDSRDVLFWANDLSLGYRAYSCNEGLITSITPMLEGHLITPLNHRGINTFPIGLQDIFDVTFATRFGIGQQATLGLGLVVPLTGPKPFDWEAQVQFNYNF